MMRLGVLMHIGLIPQQGNSTVKSNKMSTDRALIDSSEIRDPKAL